jgi:uncharacterized membrane protein
MNAEPHRLETEIARLNHLERRIIDQFIHRQRVVLDPGSERATFGDRLADRVAAFGGSWKFIFLSVAAIAVWMLVNALIGKPFDPFPYIFLNLVLSCLAALQAPVIMMSQNRQAAHDRIGAEQDYHVNTKAELEIVALHTKLDEIREQKWVELLKIQEQQLTILARLSDRHTS